MCISTAESQTFGDSNKHEANEYFYKLPHLKSGLNLKTFFVMNIFS